jgi:hypothetical protein
MNFPDHEKENVEKTHMHKQSGIANEQEGSRENSQVRPEKIKLGIFCE